MYAGDDPVNYIDPLGLSFFSAFTSTLDLATGFIIGEGSCSIAAEALGLSVGGPVGLLAAATVCATAGVLEAHAVRTRFFGGKP